MRALATTSILICWLSLTAACDDSAEAAIGKSCAIHGNCPPGTQCQGLADKANAAALCTTDCKEDSDCPPMLHCGWSPANERRCVWRGFCAPCTSDDQCGAGNRCLALGGGSFCGKACSAGGSECPRYADCKKIDGHDQCVHKAGTCVGDGSRCTPCNHDADCVGSSRCSTIAATGERYCTDDCSTNRCDDANKFECLTVKDSSLAKVKRCVPKNPNAVTPSCVRPLSQTMAVGAILDDFSMVGYQIGVDAKPDDPHQLKVLSLSSFASSHRLILFDVSVGWCASCLQATKAHKALLAQYQPRGLMIFQVLFDGAKRDETPTVSFLDQWVAGLGAVGAVGLDPEGRSRPYLNDGVTPLNLLLDAKTRRVLWRQYGSDGPALEAALRKHLPAR